MRLYAVLSGLLLGGLIATQTPLAYAEEVIAPEFSVATDEGRLALSQLRGKVVYLDFWASWCIPCRKSMPWMNTLHARYKQDGLVILAVNVDKDQAEAKRFIDELKPQFTIGYDPQGEVASLYQLKGMPSSFIIDRAGRLHAIHVGFRTAQRETYENEIAALLRQP